MIRQGVCGIGVRRGVTGGVQAPREGVRGAWGCLGGRVSAVSLSFVSCSSSSSSVFWWCVQGGGGPEVEKPRAVPLSPSSERVPPSHSPCLVASDACSNQASSRVCVCVCAGRLCRQAAAVVSCRLVCARVCRAQSAELCVVCACADMMMRAGSRADPDCTANSPKAVAATAAGVLCCCIYIALALAAARQQRARTFALVVAGIMNQHPPSCDRTRRAVLCVQSGGRR